MTFTLSIRQRGRTVERWPAHASVAQIIPAMEGEADHRAARARRENRLEPGYYDLVLEHPSGNPLLSDSQVQIC